MTSRRFAIIVACAATMGTVLLVAACGAGDDGPDAGVTPAGTINGGATSASTTTAATSFPADAETYTRKAIEAWAAKDSAALDQYEVAGGTLHTMLGCDGCYNTNFTLAPGFCQGAMGSSYCKYFNTYGDRLWLKVDNTRLGGPQAIVTGSSFEATTLPNDLNDYCLAALTAWVDDNANRVLALTKGITLADITATGAPKVATGWTELEFGGGAMGTVYVSFTHNGTDSFNCGFANNPPESPGIQHLIRAISYLP